MLRAYVALTALALVAFAVFSPEGEPQPGHDRDQRMGVAEERKRSPTEGRPEFIQLLYVFHPNAKRDPVKI